MKVRGDGPEAADIPQTVATVNGNEVSITDVEASGAFPNEVKRYNPLRIYWEICCADGGGWVNAGKNENEGFITLADPACSPPFRTVLHLACKNGGTDENSCVTNTWSSFSGPANVCAWNDTAKDHSRALHYYQNVSGDYVTTTSGLLAGANGQCHAWAHLFKECLRANNVQNVMRTRVEPYAGYRQFGVKNIDFDDVNPTYPTEPVWKYGYNDRNDDLDIDASGIPGQNMSTPQAKLFAQHWLVHRTGDAVCYDPSYGTTCSGPEGFSAQGVDAWERWWGGSWHWATAASVGATVTFTDLAW